MIRRITMAGAALLALAVAPAALATDHPASHAAALALGASTGQPVVLDFFTEW